MLPRKGRHLFFMIEKYDIISIGAHSDDAEVGAGGTPEIRAEEAPNAAKIMGADLLESVDWGDTRLEDKPLWQKAP